MSVVHKTKGIVLRSIKYGETSLIVTILTELFGVQSYIVNGVRQATRKASPKANHFQPSSILDLVVYKNDLASLQRIKEFKWGYLYKHVLSDVWKNAVALFMIELLTKSVKEPESNPDLFYFTEDALQHLDEASPTVAANMPLFYALHLAAFFGFRIHDEYSEVNHFLDLQEGTFVSTQPEHAQFLEGKEAEVVSYILKIMQPEDLSDLHLNQDFRRRLLHWIEIYYAMHIPEFGTMKTLPVLREIAG